MRDRLYGRIPSTILFSHPYLLILYPSVTPAAFATIWMTGLIGLIQLLYIIAFWGYFICRDVLHFQSIIKVFNDTFLCAPSARIFTIFSVCLLLNMWINVINVVILIKIVDIWKYLLRKRKYYENNFLKKKWEKEKSKDLKVVGYGDSPVWKRALFSAMYKIFSYIHNFY